MSAAAMHRLVAMGVAGSGKSTLAAGLASALGGQAIEGDRYHLPASQEKMRRGIALQDSDREPWLDRLGDLMARHAGAVVVTCSALRRSYRERLRAKVPGLRFVYIAIDAASAAERVRSRAGHFFPAALVASQFEALQPPTNEPGVLEVAATLPLEAQIDAVLQWLAARPAALDRSPMA